MWAASIARAVRGFRRYSMGNCRLSQDKTCIKNNVLLGYLAACLQNRANPLEHRRKLAYNDFVRCTISSSRHVGKGLS